VRLSSYRRPETSESTALETDVVRFMAVTGLTLMVVFALVHGLPYEGTAEAPPPAEPAPAEDLILIPRTELADLEETERRLAEERQARSRLEQQVGRANERAAELAKEVARERARAETLSEEVAEERTRVEDLAAVAERERERAEQLASAVQREQRESSSLERELESAQARLAEAERERPVESEVPEPEVLSPAPVDAGAFVLRFRDDEVYLDLVGRERVRSYVRIPGLDLTYEISRDARGRLGFALVYDLSSPRMYRIPDAMVPGVLLRATHRFDKRLAGRRDLEYLVVLSDRIRDQVGRLEADGRGGTWDILPDESVVAAR
jgi:hypothetical protein